MNYWQTGPCNLEEMGEPLVRLCEEMAADGKETAMHYFGKEGVCSFHNTDLWRKTTPADGRAEWNFWPMGYAWLCRNLYDQYLFTEDRAYLERIYPVLKENVRFCVESVVGTAQGYAMSPATSPENDFLFGEEKKEKLEEKLEEMKEKRKEAVERFSKEATNKDGKKYTKAEGKSDKEYIDELDSVMIDEAVLSAVNKFNNKLANMDPTKSKITLLGKDFKENGELDVSREVISDYKSAEELLNKIALQKRLWETKKKRDGFDERKIDAEREKFQNKADSYIDLSEKINDSVDERQYPVAVQKFDWRHPIKSIKSLFQKRKNNAIKTKMSSDFDINTTKKEALKYIEKNRKELENISATDKKKQKFHDGLEYNVSVSEEAIKKFWDSNDRENVETEDRDK